MAVGSSGQRRDRIVKNITEATCEREASAAKTSQAAQAVGRDMDSQSRTTIIKQIR